MKKLSYVLVMACLASVFSAAFAGDDDYTIYNKLDTTKYVVKNCYKYTAHKAAVNANKTVDFSKSVTLSVKFSQHDGVEIKCDIVGEECKKNKSCYFSFLLQKNQKHIIKIKGPFAITGPTKKEPHHDVGPLEKVIIQKAFWRVRKTLIVIFS